MIVIYKTEASGARRSLGSDRTLSGRRLIREMSEGEGDSQGRRENEKLNGCMSKFWGGRLSS